jgi:putative flippase GtrA
VSIGGELARFAVVGGIGFVVDALTLHLLVSALGWSPFAARAVSFPAAVTTTYALNRVWTFRWHAPASGFAAYGVYGAIQVIGALINLGVFSLCLLAASELANKPVLALAAGAVVAMVFNFLASRLAVFRRR